MKKSTNGDLKYTQWGLFDGTAEPHTGVSKFAIWLRNPLSTATDLQLILYKVQKVTASTDVDDNRIVKEITLGANQDWTEYTIDLNLEETYYGYCINAPKASATGYFNVDNAYYYSESNNPKVNFYAYDNLMLIKRSKGYAYIQFGNNNQVKLSPSAAASSIYVGTYSAKMNGANQEITLVLPKDNTIVGTYSVSTAGVVTFTVISVDGPLSSLVEVGAVFTNE